MKNTKPCTASDDENVIENEYGADACTEIFGDPEQPSGLLWMANAFYDATQSLWSCFTTQSQTRKLKPE